MTVPSGSLRCLAVGLWLGVAFAYLYVQLVSLRSIDQRVPLLHSILQAAPDVKSDYLYATFVVAKIHWLLAGATGQPDARIFALIDGVGIVFLFLCAGHFLAMCTAETSARCAGFLWLAATSPLLLFQHHFYHPSDFYATGLMFHALLAARGGNYLRLALLCLLSGLLWEKTLFVPFIYLLWELTRVGVVRAVLRAIPTIVTTVGCFVSWRVAFPDAPRVYGYATWIDFAGSLGPAGIEWLVWIAPLLYVLPSMAWSRRRVDRFWLCWLLYLPLLLGVVVAFRGFVRELRSFWILQPIFAGLIANWMECRSAPPQGPRAAIEP